MSDTPNTQEIITDDVLIDLETLGTKPGCVILSCVAVGLNRKGEDNDRQPKIKVVFSMTQQMLIGLVPDQNTLSWYLKDKKGQLQEIKDSGASVEELKDALSRLTEFFNRVLQGNKNACIWGNDANFDVEILFELFKRVLPDSAFPFKYYKYMNVRTIKDSAEYLFGREFYSKKDAKKSHDPEYDCEYEVMMLQKFWKAVRDLQQPQPSLTQNATDEYAGKGFT